jgi:hypothetical protein
VKNALILSAAFIACSAFAQAQSAAPPTVPAAPAPAIPAAAIPAPVTQPVPPHRWTAAQVREAFQLADGNSDGQLTRGEAQRLPIMPRSFEETDANKDGVINLGEYQAGFTQ